MKKYFVIIGLILLLIVSFFALSSLTNKNTEKSNLNDQNTSKQIPENAIKFDTTGWKVFENKIMGISFRYPSSWGDSSVFENSDTDTIYNTGINFRKRGTDLSNISIIRLNLKDIRDPLWRLEETQSEDCSPGPGPCLRDIIDFYKLELKIVNDYDVGADCLGGLNDAAYYGGFLSCKVMTRSDGSKYLLSYGVSNQGNLDKIFTIMSGPFLWLITFEINEYLQLSAPEYNGNIIEDIRTGTAPASLIEEITKFDAMFETVKFY